MREDWAKWQEGALWLCERDNRPNFYFKVIRRATKEDYPHLKTAWREYVMCQLLRPDGSFYMDSEGLHSYSRKHIRKCAKYVPNQEKV